MRGLLSIAKLGESLRHKAFLPPPLRGTPLVNEWGKGAAVI
jgi:hypothetical protein